MSKPSALRRCESRVYPADRALLLFGVADAGLAGRRLYVDGRRVHGLRFGRLTLIVAYVDPLEYTPDEIVRRRLQQSWLWSEARLHEHAVERAATHGTVAPTRLLTVFPNSAALEHSVPQHVARWSRALGRIGNRRECVLHVFVGPHAPPGREPYLVRVTERVTRRRRAPSKSGTPVCAHVSALREACAQAALATRVIACEQRGELLTAAFLTAQAGPETMRRALEHQAEAGAALGVTAYLEGPRAAFTFV